MKNKKIILAGGTGFIGEEITRFFGKENQIVILTRQIKDAVNNRNAETVLSPAENLNVKQVKWDGRTVGSWAAELENADIVINLAGKSVNCRYTEKNKKEILESRINATHAIGEAIKICKQPPALWINSGSATIYRHSEDKPQDDYSTEYLDDFSVQVCKAWEKTFNDQQTPKTRKIIFRMAITLGAGGILKPYFNLLKFGLGGKQGNGNQMYTWVHAEDTCRMIEWVYEHKEMQGAYNCCSPNPVSNKEFMRTLRQATGNWVGLPAYEWMLKIGAALIGTETELILKSRWVVPTKMLESGFTFKYPTLLEALKDIISRVPRKQYHLF